MTNEHSTCLWRVQEPSTPYQLTKTKQVTVQSSYPPLKTDNGAGAWCNLPIYQRKIGAFSTKLAP